MSFFEYSKRLSEAAEKAESLCAPFFGDIEKTAAYNGEKVLAAFINNGVAEMHLKGTTGYGYNDAGAINSTRYSRRLSARKTRSCATAL